MDTTLKGLLLPTLARLRTLFSVSPECVPGHLRMVVVKPGWTAVLGTEGQCGAAMNFTGHEGSFGPTALDQDWVQSWVGAPLLDLAAEALLRPSWQERAIGVAALSALSQPFLSPSALARRGLQVAEGDFAAEVRPSDVVALVGYGGMVGRLLGRCRELHVLDLRPREAFQALAIGARIFHSPEDVRVHGPEDHPEVLGMADALALTGSALVNGTLADLLELAPRARLRMVYGASAGFIPDVLLEAGVHLVQSHRVRDPLAFETGMLREMSLEAVIQRTQTFQTLRKLMG